jgi:hypothetical protein
MIRYAVRATPLLTLLVCCGVVAVLMLQVATWPSIAWPLQGGAVGVIGGVVAMAMDERSAAVVDTLPRGLWWRTTARAAATIPLVLTVWILCLTLWRGRLPPHLGLFALEGAAAAVLALAVTTWNRATGAAEPGVRYAAVTIPGAVALALLRPWPDRLVLFPIWPGDNWALSRLIWTGASLASIAILILALSLRPWPVARR